MLNQLRERGLKLVILSGTLERRVKEEAELLKLTEFFEGRIYGGSVDLAQFDKQMVIERLLCEERLRGENLLSFGDGPVEIRAAKSVGGVGVGVASDENHNGSGKMDSHKERQLWEAGADVLVPDYRDGENLLKSLLAR